MEEPELWRWIWLVGAALGLGGEILTAGSLVLLPFGLAAVAACVLAFLDIGLVWQWLAFVAVAGGSFAASRPLARRLDEGAPVAGIGAKRWLGEPATVLQEIPAGRNELGLVRVGRQEWRAQSRDGTALPVGAVVRVIDVVGTRLVVWPADDEPAPELPDPDHREREDTP